jgi:hypothetical protein
MCPAPGETLRLTSGALSRPIRPSQLASNPGSHGMNAMSKSRTARPPANVFPLHDEIERRAIELSLLERGQREPPNYMRTAEEELLDRAARRALRPWSPATRPRTSERRRP